MYTLSFTPEERDALLDALRKGASRHEAYVKFYRHPDRASSKRHKDMAAAMHRMFKKLSAYPSD